MPNDKPIDDGGPAYPVPLEDWRDADTHPRQGMSLRDRFACVALTGLTANAAANYSIGGCNAEIIQRAWALADEMLEARNAKPRMVNSLEYAKVIIGALTAQRASLLAVAKSILKEGQQSWFLSRKNENALRAAVCACQDSDE